jgi:hypothetical protein
MNGGSARAPPGAHDRHAFPAAHFHECSNRGPKFLGLHIVGKAPKTFVPPAGVGRIPVRAPQTAQRFEVHIFEIPDFQAACQSGAIELWIMVRPRDRADIDEALDAIGLQQRQKGLERQRRVPERKDSAFRPMRFSRWRMLVHSE